MLVLAGLLVLPGGAARGAAGGRPPNVLFVLLDDVGAERLALYRLGGDPAPTPVVDALARRGVVFRRVYAPASCSPTRLSILTGRRAFRTGIGVGIQWKVQGFEPSLRELVLPEVLATTHRGVAIGKWHLASSPGLGTMAAVLSGFTLHAGAMSNLKDSNLVPSPEPYSVWWKTVADRDGSTTFEHDVYATTDNVDDALAFLAAAGEAPWFVWLAFNAAHKPFHVPPAGLTTLAVDETSSDADMHRAAIEAADTELGRLLRAIDPEVLARTWIVVMGDDGTPNPALTPPWTPGKGKTTMYERGIHVPLIVVGPGVVEPGREVTALAESNDLFATVCDMVGVAVPPQAEDSLSLMPHLVDPDAAPRRDWIYVERFAPNGFGPYTQYRQAVRDDRYKLIRRFEEVPAEAFHDLFADPLEEQDLLPYATMTPDQRAAYDALAAVYASLGV